MPHLDSFCCQFEMRVIREDENLFEKMPLSYRPERSHPERSGTFPWLMIGVGESISPGTLKVLGEFPGCNKKKMQPKQTMRRKPENNQSLD